MISSSSKNYLFFSLLGAKIRSLLFNLDLSWFKAVFHCLWRLASYDFLTNNPVEKMADAATASKSLQSCLTLFNPIDGSPPGSPVPGILQARTLEWVAISFSNAWKWKVKVKSLSPVWLLATPWTAAHQAPLSMGFSRQEYWSGVPLPSPYYWYCIFQIFLLCVYSFTRLDSCYFVSSFFTQ